MSIVRIGLSGKMTSGKSLVAHYLADKHGFARTAFADKVKELSASLFHKSMDKEKDRLLLLQLGERMRQIDPVVWIRYTLEHIPRNQDVVIEDMRFPIEFAALRQANYYLVRMLTSEEQIRKYVKELYPTMPLDLLTHYSETGLDGYAFDAELDNRPDISLECLYQQVDTLVEQLRGRGEWLKKRE